MFIFGICEYARFLMDRDLLNNAAREGCRYALANNTSTTIGTDIRQSLPPTWRVETHSSRTLP